MSGPIRRGRVNAIQPGIDEILKYAPAGGGGGSGDVVGPASAVSGRLATFNGASGKLIQDGGSTIADVIAAGAAAAPQGDVVGPAGSTDNHIPLFDGVTGKLLKDSTLTLADVQASTVALAEAAIIPIDLATEITGLLAWASVNKTGSSLADLATRSAGDLTGTLANAVQDAITRLGVIVSGKFGNSGLRVQDTDASHDLLITPGSNLTADRILTILTGDVARTLNLGVAQSYTPVWTASGAAPVMGATTITGAYIKLGKFVFYRVLVVLGAGFAFGTGANRISLPLNSAITDTNLSLTQGLIGGGRYPGVAVLTATDAVLFNNANPAGLWSATAPAVWNVGDQYSIFGFYDETGA